MRGPISVAVEFIPDDARTRYSAASRAAIVTDSLVLKSMSRISAAGSEFTGPVLQAPRSRISMPRGDTVTIVRPRRDRRYPFSAVIAGRTPKKSMMKPMNAHPTGSGVRVWRKNRNSGLTNTAEITTGISVSAIATGCARGFGIVIRMPSGSRVTSERASGGRRRLVLKSVHLQPLRQRDVCLIGRHAHRVIGGRVLEIESQECGNRRGATPRVAVLSRAVQREVLSGSRSQRDGKTVGRIGVTADESEHNRHVFVDALRAGVHGDHHAVLRDHLATRALDGCPTATERQRASDGRKHEAHQQQSKLSGQRHRVGILHLDEAGHDEQHEHAGGEERQAEDPKHPAALADLNPIGSDLPE